MATIISSNQQMAKHIKETRKKYGTILECYWDDEIDSVLTQDTFLDDERIQEVLDACTEEAWAYVYANRHKYPARIRKCIEPNDYRVPAGKIKMVVREMTENDMARIEHERSAAKRVDFDQNVWPDMKKNLPDRPHDELDDEADELWDNLMYAKQRMTDFFGKTKKYIPPSARGTVDSEQREIEEEIDLAQKEFDECEKRISEADEKYWVDKANECFQEWLREV